MGKETVVGKCKYCDDPIYRFQAVAHEGCASENGASEERARIIKLAIDNDVLCPEESNCPACKLFWSKL